MKGTRKSKARWANGRPRPGVARSIWSRTWRMRIGWTIAQPENVAYTTQTTLSVDETRDVIAALKARYPALQGPRHDDICYATQNRQDAVRELAADCDLVLVVGSVNSSNSNRLRELAREAGRRRLSGRRRRQHRSGMARGQARDRRHRRRLGPGGPGPGRGRAPAVAGWRRGARAAWRAGEHGFRAAQGTAFHPGRVTVKLTAGPPGPKIRLPPE